jgi:hypothetical protein
MSVRPAERQCAQTSARATIQSAPRSTVAYARYENKIAARGETTSADTAEEIVLLLKLCWRFKGIMNVRCLLCLRTGSTDISFFSVHARRKLGKFDGTSFTRRDVTKDVTAENYRLAIVM